MYRNLEAELARSGLTKQKLAQGIGCTPSTLSMKLSGKAPITLAEAAQIKLIINVDMPIEELFAIETSSARDSA